MLEKLFTEELTRRHRVHGGIWNNILLLFRF